MNKIESRREHCNYWHNWNNAPLSRNLTDQYLHSVEAIEIPESYNGLPVIQLGYFYEKEGHYSTREYIYMMDSGIIMDFNE